jgi:hypothetical protein
MDKIMIMMNGDDDKKIKLINVNEKIIKNI